MEIKGKVHCFFEQTFLKSNFVAPPTMVDMNRMQRGDYYSKPTHGFTEQRDKKQKTILNAKAASRAGLCSEDRSMISPDYGLREDLYLRLHHWKEAKRITAFLVLKVRPWENVKIKFTNHLNF